MHSIWEDPAESGHLQRQRREVIRATKFHLGFVEVAHRKQAIKYEILQGKIPLCTSSAQKIIGLPERSDHEELTDLYCLIECGRVENR